MYRNLKEVLQIAEENNMTIGAFNMHNLEMLPAIIRSTKKSGTPIIIQTSVGTAKYIGMNVVVNVCKTIANEEGYDVCLHLDHCTDTDEIKEAIDAGFSSVMFDGSALDFKENILKTKEVVEFAHRKGVSVEGELGSLSGVEEDMNHDKSHFTDPAKAKEFVEKTGVDALAVSVGTAHGSYKAKTNIDFELLKNINNNVSKPLVIHGGTGVKDEHIKLCIENGVRKFNVGTELLVGWTVVAREMFNESEDNASLRNNIIPCNERVQEKVEEKIELFLNK